MVKAQRKKDGFQGQKAIIIPKPVLGAHCDTHPLISKLYITDIGYYPKARFHYRERAGGAEEHILIYCYEGAGAVTIGKQGYAVAPGEFFIIPAGVKHHYQADAAHPWTIYWMHFKGDTAADWAQQIQAQLNGHKGFIPDSEKNIALFNEIYGQLERGYSMEHLLHCNMCVWHYLASFLHSGRVHTASSTDAVDTAINFMQKHVDQDLRLDHMAKHVNFSSSHFSLLFRKKTGFAPVAYFNHLKMQHACQYLLFTDKRVKEIALAVGLGDQHYFSRLFRKTIGVTPQDYRNKRGL